MDQQTQTFLGLISHELTTNIVEALNAAPLSTTELAEATETDPRVLAKHLELMKLSALVRSYREAGKAAGRPPIHWRLINQDLIQELVEFAAASRHRLIDSGDG